MADQEQIWHVDENDTPIGPVGRDDSRKQGLRYRIVRVSVEDGNGNVLLQKRSLSKKTYPGYWDTSAGGNIDYPESYEVAAKRELFEEIGIKADTLEEVAYFYAEAVDPIGNKMNRFTKVYRLVVTSNVALALGEEVSEVQWIPISELQGIRDQGIVTDGLSQTIEHYYAQA